MGFCHQKDLFRIESKPAFYLPGSSYTKRKCRFIFYEKMWRATVDIRGPCKLHGPPSRETIHALELRTGDYWKVSLEPKICTPSPTKQLVPYGMISGVRYGGLSKGQLRIVKDPVTGLSQVERATLRQEIFLPQFRVGGVVKYWTTPRNRRVMLSQDLLFPQCKQAARRPQVSFEYLKFQLIPLKLSYQLIRGYLCGRGGRSPWVAVGMAADEAGRRRYNHKRTNPKWDKEQLSKS